MQQDTSSVTHPRSDIDSAKSISATLKKNVTQKKITSQSVKPITDSNEPVKSLDSATWIAQDSVARDSTLSYQPVKKEFRFSDIDTIRAENFVQPSSSGPKLFTGHQLVPVHSNPQTYNKPNPDWFTVILFGIIFGFMWIRVFYFKIIKQLFNAFFNTSVSNQIVRDENILIQRASVMLSIMFYLVASLFLYQVSTFFQWDKSWLTVGFSRLIIFAFFIAFAYSTKLILLKITGYILDIDKPVASYIFNIFLMNNILGIILLPFVIFIAYVSTPVTHFIFWISIAIIISTFVYRLIRGVVIVTTIPKFSIFYLFLYLCALEIAPLALIFKLASS